MIPPAGRQFVRLSVHVRHPDDHSFAVNVILLLGWMFWFTPVWVIVVARKYAERLLETLDTM